MGTSVQEVVDTIKESDDRIKKTFGELKGRVDGLEDYLRETEKKFNRQGLAGFAGSSGGQGTAEQKSLELGVRALLAGDQAKANQHFIEAKAMSVGIDPSGGYIVTPQFSTEMTKVMLETAPFIGLARTVTLETGDAFEEPVDRFEAGASWVAERDERSETTTPDLGLLTVPLHEIQAEPKITQKLIDTANRDVVGWLQGKVGEKFASAESVAFHTGNGLTQPRGFMDYPVAATADTSRAWATLQYVKSGAAASVTADGLIDLRTSLRAQYRRGAVWLMNRTTIGAISKLKSGDGDYLFKEPLTSESDGTLLGYRVIEDEQMPDIAAGTYPIAFGNFLKGYTIVRRLGVRLLLDPFTSKPHVKLYTYARVGGGVNNSEAIKLQKIEA